MKAIRTSRAPSATERENGLHRKRITRRDDDSPGGRYELQARIPTFGRGDSSPPSFPAAANKEQGRKTRAPVSRLPARGHGCPLSTGATQLRRPAPASPPPPKAPAHARPRTRRPAPRERFPQARARSGTRSSPRPKPCPALPACQARGLPRLPAAQTNSGAARPPRAPRTRSPPFCQAALIYGRRTTDLTAYLPRL